MLKDFLSVPIYFFPNKYKNNDKMILKYSQYILKWKKFIVLFAINIESLKTLKFQIFFKKKLAVSIICYKCGNEDKKNI